MKGYNVSLTSMGRGNIGFPLDSLSIDIASGRYYYDLNLKDVSSSVDDGVKAFFEEALLKFNRR